MHFGRNDKEETASTHMNDIVVASMQKLKQVTEFIPNEL